MSKFLLHLFAAFAEMERGIIRGACSAQGSAQQKPRERAWGAQTHFPAR